MRERIIRAIAGILVLVGVVLGSWVHPGWFWLTIFVGVNLTQSSVSQWCLMDDILKKLNVEK